MQFFKKTARLTMQFQLLPKGESPFYGGLSNHHLHQELLFPFLKCTATCFRCSGGLPSMAREKRFGCATPTTADDGVVTTLESPDDADGGVGILWGRAPLHALIGGQGSMVLFVACHFTFSQVTLLFSSMDMMPWLFIALMILVVSSAGFFRFFISQFCRVVSFLHFLFWRSETIA